LSQQRPVDPLQRPQAGREDEAAGVDVRLERGPRTPARFTP
jgi:hypothetical protein